MSENRSLPGRFDDIISESTTARRAEARRRDRRTMLIPLTVLVVWLVAVTAFGQWERVAHAWVAAVTMIFGAFVAGSTPQGGGAVAFPVFTKVLHTPPDAARTFSLCIQAIGMGSASIGIIMRGARVDWRVIRFFLPVSAASMLATLFLVGQPDKPFWPSTLPGPYVKVTFTIVLAAMAAVVVLGFRNSMRQVHPEVPVWNVRTRLVMGVAAVIGGVATAMIGSGADVFLYLVVTVLIGVRAGVGVPTSVITMACLSVLGLVVLGLVDGHLNLTIDGSHVTAVGGQALPKPLPANQADIFGMWLAAVPVVALMALVGSRVAAMMSSRALVWFAVVLALAEVATTVIYLGPLHTDRSLQAYAVVGLVGTIALLTLAVRFRHRLLGLPPVGLDTPIHRTSTETSARYHRDIEGGR